MKAREKTGHSMWNNIAYVVRASWAYDRMLFVLMAAEAVAGMLVPLAAAFFPKLVIDLLTAGAPVQRITWVVGGFTLICAAVYGVHRFAVGAKYMRFNGLRQHYMRKLFMKFITCDYEQVESAEGQAMYRRALNTLMNGDQSGISSMVTSIVQLAMGALSFVAFSAVLLTLHPLIVLMLTLASAGNYLLQRAARLYQNRHKDAFSVQRQKLFYIIGHPRNLELAKDVRMYALRSLFRDLMAQALEGVLRWNKRFEARLAGTEVAQALTALLRDGLAYAYLIYSAWMGRISAADAVFYFAAIASFSVFVTQVMTQINSISTAHLLISDMRAFLEKTDAPEPEPAAEVPKDAPFSIEFDDVCFAYDADTLVLDHFNLTIRPGERLALVGVNGAGKTTIVKLLCGLYRPQSGVIRIGGVDASRMRRRDRFALFSCVFQDVFVLPASFAENVALCDEGASDGARVRECLKRAGLWDVVKRAPRGLSHGLTKAIDEDGLILSGGETQKLLLARALYRDAPLLVLDEPTAALDPIAESAMYAQYDRFASGKTSVFISHRLASTGFCDRVVLLHNGRIAEQGTHEGLLRAGGAYAEMFEVQSHYYRDGNPDAAWKGPKEALV